MLKRLAAEINFRRGRRYGDVSYLKRAARQDFYNSRAASELARLGVPDQILLSLMLSLSGVRDAAQSKAISNDIREILQLAIEHIETSKGQYFQDIAGLYFCGKKTGGSFVEVGTGNGVHLSNTYLMERHFGWKGILFEPDRRFHTSIRASRSAILDTRAAFSEDGVSLTFLEAAEGGELSSLQGFHFGGKKRAGTTYETKTITLTTALREQNFPDEIDFMSIDTEGSELEVLRGLDLSRYNVQFMTIEHNLDSEKKDKIVSYLAPFGYRQVCPELSHIDVWLVKQ
jgi:FkbM family methyltransferase